MTGTTATHKRVLLIDDDMVIQEMLSNLLAFEGYRVAVAHDGADAMKRLLGYEKPDAILLDLKMPGMDGTGFCKARLQNKDLAAIPLILLSGAEDIAEQATRLGAVQYLRKPVDVSALLNALRQGCMRKPEAVDMAAGI